MKHLTLLLAGSALMLAACGGSDPAPEPVPTPEAETPTPTPTPEETAAEDEATPPAIEYDQAGRTEADKARDGDRKPQETLDFIGVEPGAIVLEMEAGGGYFTPIMAEAVGPEGMVYMQNPAAFASFWGGGEPPRLSALPDQVTYLEADFDDFSNVADGSVDVVTWFQGPHEIWYAPEGMTEQLADPDATFAEIARVLKPGGLFIALDHAAPTGAPESTGGTTHRIDPNVIDKLAASKGLTKVDESDLFANPDDDMTSNVFDPAIRGKTNQFLFKYEKS
ncbi:MAG: hypothetical protein CMK09_10255 [Ponticaulis sp.]|nr:hypothetical protein [Ponticaulis sp.]